LQTLNPSNITGNKRQARQSGLASKINIRQELILKSRQQKRIILLVYKAAKVIFLMISPQKNS
jgi:hypothetical protein